MAKFLVLLDLVALLLLVVHGQDFTSTADATPVDAASNSLNPPLGRGALGGDNDEPASAIVIACTSDSECDFEAQFRCRMDTKICDCPLGYLRSGDECLKVTCTDDKQCNVALDIRYQTCNHTSQSCQCIANMELSADGFSCVTKGWIIAVIITSFVVTIICCIFCAIACCLGYCSCIGGPQRTTSSSSSAGSKP